VLGQKISRCTQGIQQLNHPIPGSDRHALCSIMLCFESLSALLVFSHEGLGLEKAGMSPQHKASLTHSKMSACLSNSSSQRVLSGKKCIPSRSNEDLQNCDLGTDFWVLGSKIMVKG